MCCFVVEVPLTVVGCVFKILVTIFLVIQVLLGIGAVVTAAVVINALAPSYAAADSGSLAADLSLFAYISEAKSFAQSSIAEACGMVIAVGIALILTGLYGLSAIISHHPQGLLLLLAALVVSAALSTGGTVASTKWRSEAAQSVLQVMQWTLQTQYDGNLNSTNKWSRLWDLAQISLNCCGLTNGSDYGQAQAFRRVYVGPEVGLDPTLYFSQNASGGGGFLTGLQYPITCCKLTVSVTDQITNVLSGKGAVFDLSGKKLLQDPQCLITPTTTNSYVEVGCLAKVNQLKGKYVKVLEGVAGATVGVQYLIMLLVIAVIYTTLP